MIVPLLCVIVFLLTVLCWKLVPGFGKFLLVVGAWVIAGYVCYWLFIGACVAYDYRGQIATVFGTGIGLIVAFGGLFWVSKTLSDGYDRLTGKRKPVEARAIPASEPEP